jgi:DNA modification methylase
MATCRQNAFAKQTIAHFSPKLSNELSRITVTYRAPADLTILPGSPRIHSPQQIRQISRSIGGFGFLIPIVIDEASRVLAGAARLLAARELGFVEVPTVQVTHLDEAQKKAFALAENRLAELSQWDDRLLAEQLKELSLLNLDFDLEITGFAAAEIDLRIESLSTLGDDAADRLQIQTQDDAISEDGDLWLLGRHRLICGSAQDPVAFSNLMGSEKATAVFIDPPFNVKIDGHVSGLGKVKHREFLQAAGELSPAEFVTFLRRSFELLARHSTNGSLHYVFMDWRHLQEALAAGSQTYHEMKNLCIWAKTTAGMGSFYRSQHELVLVYKHGRSAHRNNIELGRHGKNRSNVWAYEGANSFGRGNGETHNLVQAHPTVKPVAMISDGIMDCTARGDLVLDSFLGSGTTLIACEKIGRRCHGIELDPLYVDLIVRRWQFYTGDHARHALSGRTFKEIESERTLSHG